MRIFINPTIQKVGFFVSLNKDFIHSWTMPEYICDEILHYYHNNTDLHKEGVIEYGNSKRVSNDKQATEIHISPDNNDKPFGDYRSFLQKGLNEYCEEYPHVNNMYSFNVTETYNIQHYKKDEGFKIEHFERTGQFDYTIKRCLVFMTYLNDVDAGGTKFIYQNRTIKAQKGKSLIFPSDWTHTHVGQISSTQEKTIVTGWFSHLW